MVVGWTSDVGKLGTKAVDYLKLKLDAREFGEIGPEGFFPLTGVSIEDDVAQFPESKFYSSQEHNLIIFQTSPPRSAWHRFLGLVLDVAEKYCRAGEMYTIGGMISFGPHTNPRELLAVANTPEMRGTLVQHGLDMGMDYETPPGQRPTLSSYLLWAARRRNIAAASLWIPVPFYLAANEDPLAARKVLSFIDSRLSLGLDFTDLDAEVSAQAQRLAELRASSPHIDQSISKLESKQALTQEENEKLVKGIDDSLKRKR